MQVINRGGLYFVKDEVYTLFLEVELKTRQNLSAFLSGRKICKGGVVGVTVSDDDVQFQISTNIGDESDSQELLKLSYG